MTQQKRRSHRELRKPKKAKPAPTAEPRALAVRPLVPASPAAAKKRK